MAIAAVPESDRILRTQILCGNLLARSSGKVRASRQLLFRAGIERVHFADIYSVDQAIGAKAVER